ncbi:hypothetical protein [Peribacillus butanolivorans]|uniref:hypothetical protein n=1 Tax=Peribacillus butanolivorans TaxID=421767 RepID=UPI0038181901
MTKKSICALCKNERELELSHIIPKFVFRYLKRDSFSGIIRNATNPNVALQDGDKKYLLCSDCEDIFSDNERKFSNNVFLPFKKDGVVNIKYDGNWLLHFITSVNWRTLFEDMPSFIDNKDDSNSLFMKQLSSLEKAEVIMRQFLLGKKSNLGSIETHLFFYENVEKMSREILHLRPHSMVHGGVFGYTVISTSGGIFIFNNLLGVIIVTIIKAAKNEKWKNTFVKNESGKIKSPQKVVSPIFEELSYMNEQREKGMKTLSEKQRKSIIAKIEKDPEAFMASESFKRINRDRNIMPID